MNILSNTVAQKNNNSGNNLADVPTAQYGTHSLISTNVYIYGWLSYLNELLILI